jgi:type IV pilus assembly protein PilZ
VSDNRKHPRKAISIAVAFSVQGAPRLVAMCRDLSLGGMFIESATPLAYGATMRVFLALPGLHEEVEVEGTVRWTKPDGMGVQFGVMGARATHALTEMLGP